MSFTLYDVNYNYTGLQIPTELLPTLSNCPELNQGNTCYNLSLLPNGFYPISAPGGLIYYLAYAPNKYYFGFGSLRFFLKPSENNSLDFHVIVSLVPYVIESVYSFTPPTDGGNQYSYTLTTTISEPKPASFSYSGTFSRTTNTYSFTVSNPSSDMTSGSVCINYGPDYEGLPILENVTVTGDSGYFSLMLIGAIGLFDACLAAGSNIKKNCIDNCSQNTSPGICTAACVGEAVNVCCLMLCYGYNYTYGDSRPK